MSCIHTALVNVQSKSRAYYKLKDAPKDRALPGN